MQTEMEGMRQQNSRVSFDKGDNQTNEVNQAYVDELEKEVKI